MTSMRTMGVAGGGKSKFRAKLFKQKEWSFLRPLSNTATDKY